MIVENNMNENESALKSSISVISNPDSSGEKSFGALRDKISPFPLKRNRRNDKPHPYYWHQGGASIPGYDSAGNVFMCNTASAVSWNGGITNSVRSVMFVEPNVPKKLLELRRSDMWSRMNLTAIEMLDFNATPTEFEKGGGIVMAINISSLRDWVYDLMKMCFLKSIGHHDESSQFPAGKFALSP